MLLETISNIRVVVFDLGGVLMQLKDPVTTFRLEFTEAEFLERWLKSPAVRAFECGATDAETFGRAIVGELGLAMDWRDFLARFDAWPERIYPETAVLFDAIPAGIGRALLSNTNAVHWGRGDVAMALADQLDKTFLSFRTGLLKPDREAFLQVIEAYGLPADTFLFFDDNPLNITAARETGMHAALCKGPSDALRSLRQMQA